MKHHRIAASLAVSALWVCVAAAQNRQESTFVTKAAEGGLAEVELGNLAVQKASDPKVKEFGQRMVDDHTKANDELKSIAANKGITLPTTLDSQSAAMKNRLSTMQGAAFDRTYMRDMVNDHRKDVAEFQKEADLGSDPDVKAFAGKYLPTLQEHLKLAEQTLTEVERPSSKR
jgi:putative membrane protein